MRTLTFTLMLGLLLSASKCNDKTAMADLSTMADTQWVLQTLKGKAVEVPDGVTAPWMQVDVPQGKLSGFGGCNDMFGSVKAEASEMRINGLGSTKKMCEATSAQENAFFDVLRNANSYKLDGKKLELLQDGKAMATFLAK